MSEEYRYYIEKGFKIFMAGFRQNLASIVTMATLIFMYLAVFSINSSVAKVIGSATDSRVVRVFITEDADSDMVKKDLKPYLSTFTMKYYDKDEAKQRVIDLAPDSEKLKDLPEELFPRFFELSSTTASEAMLSKTADKIDKIDGVKSVESGKKMNEKLQKIKSVSYTFVMLLTVLTGISCCFIIFNTIRLSLYRHHRAIMLYTLFGATRPFITFPYVAASKIEATVAFLLAYFMNKIFIGMISSRLLTDSYFVLTAPGIGFSVFLYIILLCITAGSAIFSVVTFLMGQKSINEI